MNAGVLKRCPVTNGSLILVNTAHPYRGAAAPDTLVAVGPETDGVFMDRCAAALLERLMQDIHGWSRIAAVSGWRSAKEQREIWESSLQENGEAFTREYVALPGCSEHETGLAIDLGLRQEHLDFIRPAFPYEGICRTFREKAAQYGFILRYPAGKEHITGIAQEPWHFRYVGVPHAEIIENLGITLEEYLELLQRRSAAREPFSFQAGAFTFTIAYLPSGEQDVTLPETESCLVSGDNEGGRILTAWKGRED